MKDFNITVVYDKEMEELEITNNERYDSTVHYIIKNDNDIISSILDYIKNEVVKNER